MQLRDRKGLSHVVIGSDQESLGTALFISIGREHQDGNESRLDVPAEPLADLETSETGHVDVENQQIRFQPAALANASAPSAASTTSGLEGSSSGETVKVNGVLRSGLSSAFANPEIHEALEEGGVKYATRPPANDSLERDVAEFFAPAKGRPSVKPLKEVNRKDKRAARSPHRGHGDLILS